VEESTSRDGAFADERSTVRRWRRARLLDGYLGVGKTMRARRLEHELPPIRFTHDEWVTRLYGDDPDVKRAEFGDMRRRVQAQMEPAWSRCQQMGLDVVLEFGLSSRQQRDVLRAKIVALRASARPCRVTCSDRVTGQRIDKRNTELSVDFLIVRNPTTCSRAVSSPWRTGKRGAQPVLDRGNGCVHRDAPE
jgi:predicted kinase